MRKRLLRLLIKLIAPPKRIDKKFFKACVRGDSVLGSVTIQEWGTYIRLSCWYPASKEHDTFDYKDSTKFQEAWSDYLLLREFVKEF